MSDSNRIRVSIIPEVTFGVTPTSSPAFLVLATTGVTLRDRIGYQQSRTINNDRNVQDLIRLSKAAGGGIPMELTYSPVGEGLMRLITAAFAGTETAVATVASCTTDAAAFTITRGSGSFITDGIEVGDVIRTSGASVAGDNRFCKVTAVIALELTVEGEDGEEFEGSSGDVTVTRGARIKNGTTQTTFSIEVARLDLQIAQIFTGCVIDSLDFTIADEAITTVNFSVQSASSTFIDAAVSTDVFMTGATYTDPTVAPVIDSIGVPEIRSAGIPYAAKSVNMAFSNNAAPRTQIGELGAQSMRYGEFGASGRITAYLSDYAELQKYSGNISSDLWLVATDENSKGYSFSLPKVKFSDAGADVSGSNTDVLVDLAATAVKDPTELCTARLQRWD
jgi:hypothetical protein